MIEPLLAYVVDAHADDGDDLFVALHEAGHVVLAMAYGISVYEATIVSSAQHLGYVDRGEMWPHRQADVHEGSDWLSITVGVMLAGDRALRIHGEYTVSACGGLGSDYARAMRLLEAALREDKSKAEVELDRLTQWVDEFFRRPLAQRRLAVIAAALLKERRLPGVRIQQLFCPPRTCGAFSPEEEAQCISDHCGPRGKHYLRWGGQNGDWGEWKLSWSPEGKVFKKDRSNEWKAVDHALRAPLPKPRAKPIPSVEEVPALLRRAKDHRLGRREQERSFKAAGRALGAHIREHNLAPLRLRAEAELERKLKSPRDQHAEDCGRSLDPDLTPEGEVWCRWCGFEFPARGRGWAYLVTVRVADQDPVVLGALASAPEAQAALRIHASYGEDGIWVDRVPAGRLRTEG